MVLNKRLKPRNWMVTVFDWNDDMLKEWKRNPFIKTICAQEEVCPRTKRDHLQCYFEFTSPIRMNAAKIQIQNSGAHFEPRMGTRAEAIKYCTKEESRKPNGLIIKKGNLDVSQGERTDLQTALQVLQESKGDINAVWEKNPRSMVLNYRGLSLYANWLQDRSTNPRIENRPEIIIYTGPTGIGKTTFIKTLFPQSDDTYWLEGPTSTSTRVYWNEYRGQTTVVLDEFDGSWFQLRQLLRILDNTPLRVSGMLQPARSLRSFRYIFCSNLDPTTWYNDPHGALARRFRQFSVTLKRPKFPSQGE